MTFLNSISKDSWIHSTISDTKTCYENCYSSIDAKINQIATDIKKKEFRDLFTSRNLLLVGFNFILINWGMEIYILSLIAGMGLQLLSPDTMAKLKIGSSALNNYFFKHHNIMVRTAYIFFTIFISYVLRSNILLFLTTFLAFKVGSNLMQNALDNYKKTASSSSRL